MLFKIKLADYSHYKFDKKEPYILRYEWVPDISKGIQNQIIHQSSFSNLRNAQKVADDLSKLLADAYLYLDLVFTKLKQLEVSIKITEKYLQLDFNELEKVRIQLLKNSLKTKKAYEHIEVFDNYINLLKKFCFNISRDYYSIANQIFQQLISFEEHFINLYRSSKILSEKNQLRLFA